MEKTETIPRERIQSVLPGLHPMLRMLSARCLLVLGQREGLEVLVGVLDAKRGEGVERSEATCAATAARMILTEIAAKDLGPRSGPWKQWLAEQESIPATKLKHPAPITW